MVPIIKSRLILVTCEVGMPRTMGVIVAEIKAAERRLINRVKPLNQRLKAIDMHVYWDGEYKQWFINRFAANDRGGISFWLDERKYKKLITMNDEQLLDYCKNWGAS